MSKPSSRAARPQSLRKATLPSSKQSLAFGVSALMLSSFAAAQDDEVIMLDTLEIEERTIDTNPYAEDGTPYKAKISGDARHSKPIAETPQTISVLTQTQIQDSGRDDLREVLQGQPGITLGTGENGNAFGDRYIIRGHEARSDVFVDGLRDPGMTTRESFATEQIEISKGPSSTFAGRGSTGGAINSVTKQASTEYDFTKVQAGLGTSAYRRATLDANQKLNEDAAVRVNLLHAYEEVPDREPADRTRNGIALSGLYEFNEKFSAVADYYHLKAEDAPDLGTYIEPNGGEPVEDIAVYVQDEDFQDSTVDTYTLRLNYEFADNLRLQNSTRYGTTENGYVVTGARGGERFATDPFAPGEFTIGLSTHQGWQDVEYFVDQLNLYWDLDDVAGMDHQFVFGAEYSELNVLNGNYDAAEGIESNCVIPGRPDADGNPTGRSGYCIIDPEGNLVGNLGSFLRREITRGDFDSDYNIDTLSLYVMDTIDLNDQWSIFAGVRLDSFDYENTVVGREGIDEFAYSDDLWNGHLGAVYEINEQGNVYLTYSTSANINGGESDLGGNCGYGGICGDDNGQVTDSKPETTQNIELGTKWNLMNEKLLLTAAIFQITKDDVMEGVGDDYESLGTLNTGKNRVQGIELSLVGNITEKLSAQIGLATMESEVLESYETETVGRTLSNFADDSAFVQLRYQLTPKFAFGGTASYSSEQYAGQPDAAAGFNDAIGDYSYEVPSYTVVDAFAEYEFSEQLNLRLNVLNVADEDYYLAAYRSGAFTYLGDSRKAYLTLGYEF